MTVGIPGTGIGGLCYLLLALAMPVRELALTLRGKGSLDRWRFIAIQWGIIGGMLGLMAVQGMALKRIAGAVVARFPASEVGHDLQTVASSSSGLAINALWLSLSMLAAIVLAVQGVRLYVRASDALLRRRTMAPAAFSRALPLYGVRG